MELLLWDIGEGLTESLHLSLPCFFSYEIEIQMETFTVPPRMRKSWYLLIILGCNLWVPPSPDVPGAAGMLGQGPWCCRRSGMPRVPRWVPGPGHPAGAAPLVPLVGTGMVASYLARTRGRCLSSPWARCRSRASRSARPPSSLCRSPRRAACPCSGKQQQGTLVPWRATLCHHVPPRAAPPHGVKARRFLPGNSV